jgi:hypothetical protein
MGQYPLIVENTEEGKEFIRNLKANLTGNYTIRVRGKGLNAAGKAIGWKRFQYGAPLKYSTHLRIYFVERKA